MQQHPTTKEHILQQSAQDGIELINLIHSKGERIHPEFLSMHSCKAIILLIGTKVGCGVGVRIGQGYLLAKLTDPSHRQQRWSAPIFLKVRIAQCGLDFGYAKSYSYMVAMSNSILKQLSSGKRLLCGVDSTFVAGGSTTESKSDVIALSSKDSDLIVAAVVKGAMLDFSLACGYMSVDDDAMKRVYGVHDDMVGAVVRGEIPPPQEMNPLYDFLSTMVEKARVSPPDLVRASLERMTAGYEPDRRIITSVSARVLHRGDTSEGLYERNQADFDD